ncbi:DUF1244 domain-containing protein [Rhodobacter sp. 24-YEA-8]|uniref:DUF1244 domain-containing protein n=1 Tax=Rhodobacter sp. 24-YEA-8 TaxID=1884310 RepID=UPI000899E655|nr:DUF1244 domain-containing protein [Rhodobacter sp. 24-YEA-8]SEC52061.1 hypothetical protein SAMN05519105_2739 [Rhodobacter sp. 24-YEA-8]
MSDTPTFDDQTRTELEAATFRALMHHLLDARPDVQNIDLMTLAGFCRNCLSRWYQDAAAEKGITLTKDAAREQVYGMPYADWVAANQTEAGPEKQAAFRDAFAQNVAGKS